MSISTSFSYYGSQLKVSLVHEAIVSTYNINGRTQDAGPMKARMMRVSLDGEASCLGASFGAYLITDSLGL